jgi:hypothetical protein
METARRGNKGFRLPAVQNWGSGSLQSRYYYGLENQKFKAMES